MKQLLYYLLPLCLLSCQPSEKANGQITEYLRWVGDSKFDPALDRRDFNTCFGDKVAQYFNFSQGLQYEGEKKAIWDTFQAQYRPVESTESGWLRIRFIVNCQGETGRFRLTGMNTQYQETSFDPKISDQLLSICKSLNGWQLQPDTQNPRDYYQYLIFKIEAGDIKEILP